MNFMELHSVNFILTRLGAFDGSRNLTVVRHSKQIEMRREVSPMAFKNLANCSGREWSRTKELLLEGNLERIAGGSEETAEERAEEQAEEPEEKRSEEHRSAANEIRPGEHTHTEDTRCTFRRQMSSFIWSTNGPAR